MTTVTLHLAEDLGSRLAQMAASRGLTVDQLVEELAMAALANFDARRRFLASAAAGDRQRALDLLARLDAAECAA